MIRYYSIVLFIFTAFQAFSQDILLREIKLDINDLPIKNVLDHISGNTGIYFTYAGNMDEMDKKVTLHIDKITVGKLLTDLFYKCDISYTTYANQVILKKKTSVEKLHPIRGIVLSSNDQQPVEFSTLQLKQSRKGTIAGEDGKFEFLLSEINLKDSLVFYCIGYEPQTFSVKLLTGMEFHTVFLTPRVVELNPVELAVKKPEIKKEGNSGIAMGSLDLDTHGQQVALFIDNKKKYDGKIKTVSYYLSGKGNTEAPFRIRIYSRNDSLGCPETELLPDIIVVKPGNKSGWFKVDISRYNIRFPESGLFISMEGIYPGDYNYYINASNEETENEGAEEKDDFLQGSLDYGQRIGYSRFSHNNTWHYSLSNTWFQLDKRNFNVLISAEIVMVNPKKHKKQSL